MRKQSKEGAIFNVGGFEIVSALLLYGLVLLALYVVVRSAVRAAIRDEGLSRGSRPSVGGLRARWRRFRFAPFEEEHRPPEA